MPDEIVLARIMTALDLEFEAMYMSIKSQLLIPPSTPLTMRKYNVPSLPSCPDDPGMSYLSVKGSTEA